ncbi:MAG TPA: hypothetical protein PK040_03580 [Anaerolineaceae bacterium]|nr:hypothetical protein [Anaerolineaceae bacterium]
MRKTWRILALFFMLVLLLLPAAAHAQTPSSGRTYEGDKVVIASTFRLDENDVLNGNLLVIGGTATAEKGSLITGDVVLIGGTLNLRSTVNGEIVAIGGVVILEDSAVVNGDVVMIGADLHRSDLARIDGEVTEQIPRIIDVNPTPPVAPSTGGLFSDPLGKLLRASYQALGLGLLGFLVGLLLPLPIKRVQATILQEPVASGVVGLLVLLVAPIVLGLLSITIILIPLTVLAAIALALLVLFGWFVLGYEVGRRVALLFHTNWSPSILTGIGTLLLTLAVGLLGLIPCIGWLAGALAAFVGLGAIGMTLYLMRNRKPATRPPSQAVPPVIVNPVLPDGIAPDDQKE